MWLIRPISGRVRLRVDYDRFQVKSGPYASDSRSVGRSCALGKLKFISYFDFDIVIVTYYDFGEVPVAK